MIRIHDPAQRGAQTQSETLKIGAAVGHWQAMRAPCTCSFAKSQGAKEDCMTVKHRGETSGTTRRAARQVSGQGVVFQLTDEVRSLRTDLHQTSGGRAAKTLAKTDGLRVTLVLLKSGATLNPESAAGGASLQVVEGRMRVQTKGDHRELGPGDLIALGENLHEPVTALEETAFLVTVSWPAGAGAWEQEGR
jgi:quercetin dioxygenase-like cupin family protein